MACVTPTKNYTKAATGPRPLAVPAISCNHEVHHHRDSILYRTPTSFDGLAVSALDDLD
jgi:hypothetical protein